MKNKYSLFFLWIVASLTGSAQIINKATFDDFVYSGNDTLFSKNFNPSKQYLNPIVAGFYPDPSVCRNGKDYYLVNSSFSYFPRIPIWHSTDLVNWKQIGHVLDRSSQVNLDGLDLSAGIFAPTIRYNNKNKTFYMICTVVGGINNFLVKTKDINKGWSEPILLPQVKGIDPSLFFDDNGKAYIVNCGIPKVSNWRGHRAVWLFEYDTQNDKIINEGKIIADGGIDTAKHPIWLEGPHLYKINEKYYLMAAEGGTSEGHSEVIFESNQVDGAYKPCAINPILTQRNLPKERADKITSTGHADLIETAEGDWYAVFLATRPYSDTLYSTGRETFLLPVTWKNGVPVILDNGKTVPIVVDKKGLSSIVKRPTGNFVWKDDFSKPTLGLAWNMLRTPRDTWYSLQNGKLVLDAINRSIYDKVNAAFLGRRQQHTTFSVQTALTFTPQTSNELAGIVLFQNEKKNIVIGKTLKDGRTVLVVQNRKLGINEIVASVAIPDALRNATITLGITVNKNTATVYYSYNRQPREILAENIDVKFLTTKLAGGFVGSYIGMYATGNFK